MRDLVVRIWRLYHTPHGRKLFRYTMVSAISTAVSFGVLFITFGLLRLWSEVPDTLVANVVAIGPSYYLNRNWAWGKSGRSHFLREIVPFWSMSIAGIVLSIFTSSEAKHFSDVHHFHHLGRTVIVLAANLAAFGVLWIVKFLIMNKLFHVHPVDDDADDELVEVAGA